MLPKNTAALLSTTGGSWRRHTPFSLFRFLLGLMQARSEALAKAAVIQGSTHLRPVIYESIIPGCAEALPH